VNDSHRSFPCPPPRIGMPRLPLIDPPRSRSRQHAAVNDEHGVSLPPLLHACERISSATYIDLGTASHGKLTTAPRLLAARAAAGGIDGKVALALAGAQGAASCMYYAYIFVLLKGAGRARAHASAVRWHCPLSNNKQIIIIRK
jgi:hypothetical protein